MIEEQRCCPDQELVNQPINFSKEKYFNLARLFIKEYIEEHKVRSKAEFCKKYGLCFNTLNKYLFLIQN